MTRTRLNNPIPVLGRFFPFMVIALFLVFGNVGGAEAAERKLAFAVRGVVVEILVKPGDTVSAGQPLARLDDSMMKVHLGVMEAKAKAAELAATLAEKSLQREQELFDAISTTSAKVEAAELAAAEAAANLAQAIGRKKAAQMRLDRATLKVPFAGTVMSVPGFPGQVINPDAAMDAVVVLNDGQ